MQYITPPPELIIAIKSASTIGIVSHLEPDGDCIGSSLALGSFLQRLKKRVVHYNPGPFDRPEISSYQSLFITPTQITPDLPKTDLFIVVDCSTLERISPLEQLIESSKVCVIDHHTSGKPFGDISWLNPSSPSTSLMIQQLIEAMEDIPTQEEAELIFFGFATDTGYFRHLDEDTALVFEQISKLITLGVSPKTMYHQVTGGKQLASRKHLGMLMVASEELFNGRVILACETKEMTDRYGRTNRDSDGFYQQMLGVQGVEIIVVLREDGDGSVTGGLRSKHTWDMGEMASHFSGGGHQRAAGFKVEGSIVEVRQTIVSYLTQLLS